MPCRLLCALMASLVLTCMQVSLWQEQFEGVWPAMFCMVITNILMQVETIMISIISMLSSPNDESPANIDAAKQWREDREGFKRKVARVVRKSQEML